MATKKKQYGNMDLTKMFGLPNNDVPDLDERNTFQKPGTGTKPKVQMINPLIESTLLENPVNLELKDETLVVDPINKDHLEQMRKDQCPRCGNNAWNHHGNHVTCRHCGYDEVLTNAGYSWLKEGFKVNINYYCRACGEIFPVSKKINGDPNQDPKWTVDICPKCQKTNVFMIRKIQCKFERETYDEKELKARELEGTIFCKSFACYTKLERCGNCDRFIWKDIDKNQLKEYFGIKDD